MYGNKTDKTLLNDSLGDNVTKCSSITESHKVFWPVKSSHPNPKIPNGTAALVTGLPTPIYVEFRQ